MAQLETFVKAPLGGIDRRVMLKVLAEEGPAVAARDLEAARATLAPRGVEAGDGACVLMLGGSNGILRAVAIELRSHVAEPLWRRFWDTTLMLSSALLPVLFGTALGNVIRGVPLDGALSAPLLESLRATLPEIDVEVGLERGRALRFEDTVAELLA